MVLGIRRRSSERYNGCGLALVLQILRQSGGTVAVEIEEGRGSIFTVKIPRSKAVEKEDEESRIQRNFRNRIDPISSFGSF